MKQGELKGMEVEPPNAVSKSACEKAGAAFRRRMIQVVNESGEKQGLEIAADAGMDPGHFSKALHHQGVHLCVECVLPHVMIRDPKHFIVQGFAQFHGGVWLPKPVRTPEETLRFLIDGLEEMGLGGPVAKLLGRLA